MANSFEVTGTIKEIKDVQTFSSGFTKREFVCTIDDDYPQDIKFACVKDRCALLDHIAVNDRVKVTFRLRGNLWKDRYFVDLQAYKLDKVNADGTTVAFDEGEPVAAPIPAQPPVAPTDEPMPF
jgi:single-strand DNA-binding protein